MCKLNKSNGKHPQGNIDPCMRNFMKLLGYYLDFAGLKIVACCCGHKKYKMSIIVEGYLQGTIPITGIWTKPSYQELVSGEIIHKHGNGFYKRDKQGYYYIPEVSEEK
jgi:hypothetical protein